MIINIAGTSGSGKSTLVRNLMAQADAEHQHEGKRKDPIGYLLRLEGVARPVFVVGAYVAGTGGCDTIKDVVRVYDLVKERWRAGEHVVYEGLFVMNHTRGIQLWKGTRAVTMLKLTTPIEVCFESIAARRAEKGITEPVTRKNTEGNFVRANNYAYKMKAVGAPVFRVSRDEALPRLLELLRGDGA